MAVTKNSRPALSSFLFCASGKSLSQTEVNPSNNPPWPIGVDDGDGDDDDNKDDE